MLLAFLHYLIDEICFIAAHDIAPGKFAVERRDGLDYIVPRVEGAEEALTGAGVFDA